MHTPKSLDHLTRARVRLLDALDAFQLAADSATGEQAAEARFFAQLAENAAHLCALSLERAEGSQLPPRPLNPDTINPETPDGRPTPPLELEPHSPACLCGVCRELRLVAGGVR